MYGCPGKKIHQAFAAIRCTLLACLSRQAMEQKCTISPPSRSGMDSSSATCIPQTGSRTNRLGANPPCVWPLAPEPAAPAASLGWPGVVTPRTIHTSTRRKSATLHETTSSQNKYLTMRIRNSIDSSRSITRRRREVTTGNPAFAVTSLKTNRESPGVPYADRNIVLRRVYARRKGRVKQKAVLSIS